MSKLALDGGTPVRDTRRRPWPTWPDVSEKKWLQQERVTFWYPSRKSVKL